jgi:hypothetical protein
MNKQILLTGTIVLLALAACNKNADCNGMTVKDLEVNDFTSIKLISDFDVTIAQSDSAYISLQGCTSDLDRIKFQNSNGHVELKRGNGKTSDEPIRVVIGMPDLRSLETEGTVDVDIAGFTTPVDRFLKIRGTGLVKFNGISTLLTLNVEGTSKMELSGSAYEIEAHLSGTSRLKAYGLVAQHCTIDISGTAEAEVWIETSLKGRANGVTVVRYKGNPGIVDVQMREMAKVIKE